MLGQVKMLDRLSTSARFETKSGNENVAGGSSCLRTHSTRSLYARPPAQLQQLSTTQVLHCSATCYYPGQKIETGTRAKHRRVHARQITRPVPRARGCLNFFGQGSIYHMYRGQKKIENATQAKQRRVHARE